jgi:regulator of cell morphogenesis and NO signaling
MPDRLVPPTWTVNEVLRRYPDTVPVFNAFGIDACCGGAVPVLEAARRDHVDPALLLDALGGVIRAAGEAVSP